MTSYSVPSDQGEPHRSGNHLTTASEGRPFGTGASVYRKLGWPGVLPCGMSVGNDGSTHWEPRQKHPVPRGYTGREGQWPDDRTVERWAKGAPGVANIALRLPDGLIGIDVDQYGHKRGLENANRWADGHGVERLPVDRTVRSSAREAESGIYLFRTPLGAHWPGQVCEFVEIVQQRHRYMLVWPSVHPTGLTYTWTVDGQPIDPPSPDDARIIELPDGWAELLQTTAPEPADLPPAEEHREALWSPAVERAYERHLRPLVARDGAAHEAATAGSMSLARLEQRGEAGATVALEKFGEAFIAEVTDPKRNGDTRSASTAASEWRRMVDGGRGLARTTKAPTPSSVVPAGTVGEHDEFWASSERLAALNQFAQARMLSSWAMLGAVLAVVASRVGPHVVLPPIVAAKASLNVFVGLVSESGGGKSGVMAAVDDFLGTRQDTSSPAVNIPSHELGTGQGVTSAYTTPPSKNSGPVNHCDSALWTLDEIGSLKSHASMNGANVLATLKSAYSGRLLGARYADSDRRRPVLAHHYRFALMAGIQPRLAGVVLDDVDGGFPQRWVWLPADDLHCPDAQPEEPLMPAAGWFTLDKSLAAQGSAWAPDGALVAPEGIRRKPEVTFDVCAEAAEAIVGARRARLRREGDLLASHTLLTREKVAALLALWHGNGPVITPWEWEAAGVVMAVSDATRAECQTAITQSARQTNLARAARDVERDAYADRQAEDQAAKRVLNVLNLTPGEWVGGAQLRKRLSQRLRGQWGAAVARLVAEGAVEEGPSSDGRDGARYRAVAK